MQQADAPVHKVIWAIDPFGDKTQLQRKTARAIRRFIGIGHSTIQPICVLSPEQLYVPIKAFEPNSRDYRIEAEKRIRSFLDTIKLPGLVEPLLLVTDDRLGKNSVITLLEYAIEWEADLIAISTRARTGVKRLFLGSFAEEMLLKSEIPLLVISPKSKVKRCSNDILFPTDWSYESGMAFQKILPIAKAMGSNVILFNQFQYFYPSYGFVLPATYDHYFSEDLAQRRRTGEEWTRKASAAGVRVETIIDETCQFVNDAILALAKKRKVRAIALASHSGRFTSWIGGSAGRQLVRFAPCPVWVMHPHVKREAAKKAA